METKETEGLPANDADEANSGNRKAAGTPSFNDVRWWRKAETWIWKWACRAVDRLRDKQRRSSQFTKLAKAVGPKMLEEQES
jgi:hypothetical protein